jgi:hypothetical protein
MYKFFVESVMKLLIIGWLICTVIGDFWLYFTAALAVVTGGGALIGWLAGGAAGLGALWGLGIAVVLVSVATIVMAIAALRDL